MHKDELIQLHTLMVQIRRYFENNGTCQSFEEYDSLSISPMHLHRSKAEHKHAIFVLGNNIASIVTDEGDKSVIGRISTRRMQEFINRSSKEISQKSH
ncbi:MAG: UPF0058 family protein [Methanosarcinaceae archaeon]|jgi:hypothetical protein|nr:UPF0058 family protein [Methanosarcinaceae archaeon]NKQ38449.1 UPF0058 family protein [Methanosarcinales archaeon]